MHTADTDGASQELSEAELLSHLNNTFDHETTDSMEVTGQLSRWGSLWAEAYRSVKDDPEYSQLLEAFERYLREAEDGMCFEGTREISGISIL